MLPSGRISHAIDGRLRARIPERKGDDRFFAKVREELEHAPGITRLQTNPLTGSVLVLHDLDTNRVAALVESRGLFRLEQGSADAPSDKSGNSGALLGSFARAQPSQHYQPFALALIALAVFEALQGNVAAPAVTLLWYAYRLLQEGPTASGGQMEQEMEQVVESAAASLAEDPPGGVL